MPHRLKRACAYGNPTPAGHLFNSTHLQTASDLIRELSTVYAHTSLAIIRHHITTLNHESLEVSVEDCAIVLAASCEREEVVARLWT